MTTVLEGGKASALLSFWVVAHNASWNSEESIVRAGNGIGGAILLSFAVECALKASLVSEGKNIGRGQMTHDLSRLFKDLTHQTRTNAKRVYADIFGAERDPGLYEARSIQSLKACLRNHDRSFKRWRYNLLEAGRFYAVPMAYACVALLTWVYPSRTFTTGSATSSTLRVRGGMDEEE